ncbi:MAG: hypothetical protein R3F59_01260 [Myxococcota bacterium]
MMLLWTVMTAHGATFSRVPDWPELAGRSHAVVQGVVVAADVFPTPQGVATRYEIEVDEVIAGPRDQAVQLVLPGGRAGDLVQRYGGVPLWDVGDEVVVFVPAAGPAMLAGVLTVDGGELVDPLGRPDPVRTVAELRERLGGAVVAPLE